MASSILEEEMDPNYQPTDEEISEYAEYLGMDLKQDKDLFWIAVKGLKEPLPGAWKPCKDGEGNVYYFNFNTGESKWDHPCDEIFKNMYKEEKIKKEAATTVRHHMLQIVDGNVY